jgi:hypothetical protein
MEGGTDTLTCTPSPRPFQQGKTKSTLEPGNAGQKPTDAGQKLKSAIDLGCEGTAAIRKLRAWDASPLRGIKHRGGGFLSTLELVRVIGAADHWAAGHVNEAHFFGDDFVLRKLLRRHKFFHRQMPQGGL